MINTIKQAERIIKKREKKHGNFKEILKKMDEIQLSFISSNRFYGYFLALKMARLLCTIKKEKIKSFKKIKKLDSFKDLIGYSLLIRLHSKDGSPFFIIFKQDSTRLKVLKKIVNAILTK